MLILGVDTSTAQVGVAVGSERGVVSQVCSARGRRHAETLAPAVEYALAEAGAAPGDLAGIAVGIGPGLFTGLRVGVATAKVMAQALRIPVVPVASLDLVAYPVRYTDRLVAAVIDARRGEVFWAIYHPVPGGLQRAGEYSVGEPEDLEAELIAVGDDPLLVGEGALLHRERFGELDGAEWASPVHAHPSPAVLVELACAKFAREEFSRPQEVEPLYLRVSDAELPDPASAVRGDTGAR